MGFFDSIGDRYRKWQEERKAKAAEKQHRKRNSASQQQPSPLQHEHITPSGPVSTRDRSASSPHMVSSGTPHSLLPPLDESGGGPHHPHHHYIGAGHHQLHIDQPASPFAPQLSSAHRSPHSASPSSSSSSSQVAARNTGGARAAAAIQLRSASPTNVSSQLSTPYRAHPSGLASVGLGSSPISHSGAVGSHSSMNQQGLSAHTTPHRPLPSGASSSAGPSSQQRSSHPRYAESKEDDIGELDEDLDHLHVSRRGPPTASPASASNDSSQPATKQDDDEQFALMLQQQEYMTFLEESGELNARDSDTLHAIEAARRAKEERRQRRRERRVAEQAAAAMAASGNGPVGSASVHLDVPHTPSPALEEDERQFFAAIQSRAHAALEQQQQQQQQRHRPHAATSADASSSERLLRSMGFISASPSPAVSNADQSLRLPQIGSSSSAAHASALARNRSYSHAQPAPSHLPGFPNLAPHSHSHSHSLNPSSTFLARSASLSNASAAPASAPLTRAASLSRAEISVLPTFHYVPSPSKSVVKVTQETTSLQVSTTDDTTGTTVTETVTSNVTAAASVPESPEDECCSICLGEFELNEKLRALPCLHKYHAACVDDWLLRSSHCPNCNTDVRAAFG